VSDVDLAITPGKAGARIAVRVVPRGSKTAIEGARDGALLVRVTAPPIEGAANDAVIAVLADAFDLARRDVVVVSGRTSRRKTVELGGLNAAAVRARLQAILR
jgi:uncharacterized protein (TIGR00251 family)